MIVITFFDVPAESVKALVDAGQLNPPDELVFDKPCYDVWLQFNPHGPIEASVDDGEACLFFNYISPAQKQAIKRQLKAFPHAIEYYF